MIEYSRILIIRLSSLGDIVLTTAFIRELKDKFITSKIDFCTKESYKDVLSNDPRLNKIITIPDNAGLTELNDLKKTISENDYELIFDLHNNLRTFYLKFFLSTEFRIVTYKKRSIRKQLLAKLKINLLKNDVPVTERYLETLHSINLSYNRTEPELFPDKKITASIANKFNIVKSPAIKRIIIFPASRHFTKTYPAELWIDLINTLDETQYEVILAGNEPGISEEIVKNSKRKIIDTSGKLNLKELISLINTADTVISGDTGPMHLAEGLNKKLICIAGPSVKELGFLPVNSNSLVLENHGLYCRPCSTVGKSYCPEKHFRCMREITPDMILEKIKKQEFSISGYTENSD